MAAASEARCRHDRAQRGHQPSQPARGSWRQRAKRGAVMTSSDRYVRAVVFDLDGVVIDSEHLWEESWAAYAGRHGYDWALADTLRMQGMSAPEWSRAIAGTIGAPERADDVLASCVGYVVDAIAAGEGPLLDGARDLLTDVAAQCPVAMASSAPRRAIDAVLAQNGIADLFAATVSSEEVPRGKPSPDVYAEAMRRLGVDPA